MAENEAPAQHGEHKEGIGSTLVSFFGEHKIMIIGLVVGGGFVLFIMSKSKNASNAGSTGATNQQGSLGAAGYQNDQTATALDQLTSTLNNFLANVPKGATGPAGPTGPTGPQGSPGTTGILPTLNWSPPLIPYSQTWSGKHYFPVAPGHRFDWQGVSYWIVSNTGGVIQGIPGATTAGQASKSGVNPVTLYAPASAYQKPVLNPLANHSPVYSWLPLGPTSSGVDLGHPGVAGSAMQVRPVSHVGHNWSEGVGASGSDSVYISGRQR